jgi:hypothetical protein
MVREGIATLTTILCEQKTQEKVLENKKIKNKKSEFFKPQNKFR